MTKKLLLTLVASVAAFTVTPAFAHSGIGAATGFAHLTPGLGQVLAMLAIGAGLGLVMGDRRTGQLWPAVFAGGIGFVTILALLHGHVHGLASVAALAAYITAFVLASRVATAISNVLSSPLVLSSTATQALGTFAVLAGGTILAL